MLAGVIAGALAALLLPGPAAARQAPPTDDPLAGDQVVIAALGLTDAWPTSTGEGVTIAVVDDGVDGEHPDLRGRLAPDADPTATTDPRGTGTHAAGVAAATGDNAEGIVGVAPGAQLLPVAVGADGDRETTGVAGAVTTAAEAGAGVIALTLGGDTGRLADALADDAVDRAVRAADAAGSVVVVADPGATDIGDLPVLLVSATEAPTGTPGGVTAPGRGVLGPAPLGPTTTWPAGTDGYETLDGLVPATAATAGVAALLVSLGRTPQEVRDLVVATSGSRGAVDAAAAVAQAGATGAGGVAVVDPDAETDGALPPAAVGGLVVGAGTLAIVLTLVFAGRVSPGGDRRHHGEPPPVAEDRD